MKLTFSKIVKAIHVWTGLIAGVVFCLLSLTGSVIVFRPEIEDLLRPKWSPKEDSRPVYVLSEAAGNIARQWPDAKIGSVSLPARAGTPIEFSVRTGDNQLQVFVDDVSGEVLGTFALPWLDWLVDLHHHLQWQAGGKQVVGAIGIVLFLSSLTGLLIWTYRSTDWRRLLGIRKGMPWQPTKFDLHRSVGILGNALLLFISATGFTMAFPQTIQHLLGAPEDAKPQQRRMKTRPKSERPPETTLEEYVAAATNAIPGSTVTQLRLADADRPITARLSVPGDLRLDGSARVSLERGTARVLTVDSPADWPFGKRIVQAATPLHYAEWGGLGLRILWSLIGMLPPILFVSGLMIWLGPSRSRVKRTRVVTLPAFPQSIPDGEEEQRKQA